MPANPDGPGFLRTLRVFTQLPEDDLRRIADQALPRTVARGTYLFREDDPSASCFIIKAGRVQLLKRVDASRKHLATRKAGELVGEIELLYGTPRMADALAASDVELLELPQAAFDALIPDGRCREAIFSSATERLLQYQNALADADRRALQAQLPALTACWVPIRSGLRRRAYPFVAADSAAAAGVACFAMVDRYHGQESSWEPHVEQLLAHGEADTLVALSRKADECGYTTRLLRVDTDAIAGLPLPAIVEDEQGAPAVLFHVDRRSAIVASPGSSIRRVPWAAFTACWRGHVLTLARPPQRPFAHLLRVNTRTAGSVVAASFITAVFGLAAPLAAKVLVDRVVVDADTTLLRVLAAGLAAAVAFRVVAAVLREQLLVHATRRAVLFLQVHLLDHILRLPLGATDRIGDAAGMRQTERLVDTAVGAGQPLLVDSLALAVGLTAIFVLSPSLALAALAFVLAYAAMSIAVQWPRRSRGADQRAAARGYLIELVSGIQTVKALASETHCTAHGTRLMLQAQAAELDVASGRRLRQATGAVLHLAAVAIVLAYGAWLTLGGAVSAGDMVASLAIVIGLIGPVESLLDARGATAHLKASAQSITRVLEVPPEDSAGHGTAPRISGHVRLTNASFRYPGASEDALTGVNLEVLPGQTVALVGRSGSGKTTLINLIVGLYPPTLGTVHVDGTDLTAMPKPALRRQCGVVEQQPFLFDGTVAENIARGDPSVTREQIVAAARLAEAHGFIMALPQGYDTAVGERGARLSGGERQRLTVARAVVADPRLIILDEATSALDSETEMAVYGALRRAPGARTIITIAHRLSTVRHADLIVVLDRGRIVETGTDRELMERRGLYYYLAARTV